MTNTTPNAPCELKPCPFCGDTPELPSGDGTQYEIECSGCGQAMAGVQICDLMTLEERAADTFTDYRYGEEFVERAKVEAIERWNTRAPSPAGVDGLEVVSNWVLFDAEADKPYIKKMLPEGFLAFFDCEEDARRAKANNSGTDYKRIDRVKAEDAQAIIDGLRGEVDRHCADLNRLGIQYVAALNELGTLRGKRDQQAQRIGELEGLLRSCLPALSDGGCAALANRIDAALAAGKEGE